MDVEQGLQLSELEEYLLWSPGVRHALQCPLCVSIVHDPVFFSCCQGAAFCKACASTVQCCPLCKKESRFDPSRFVRQMLEGLEMSCRFKCGSVFKVEARQAHEKECPESLTICSTCSDVVLRKLSGAHQLLCNAIKIEKEHTQETLEKEISEVQTTIKSVTIESRDIAENVKTKTETSEVPQKNETLKQDSENSENSENSDKSSDNSENSEHSVQTDDDAASGEKHQVSNMSVLQFLYPKLKEGVLQEIMDLFNSDVDKASNYLEEITSPLDKVLELYNLSSDIQEHHLLKLVNELCELSSPITNENLMPAGTWCFLRLSTEEDAKEVLAKLKAGGFPYIRTPRDSRKKFLFGKIDQNFNFCPELSHIDCPHFGVYHPYNVCVFHHPKIPTVCRFWSSGIACPHGFRCLYQHPGNIATELNFSNSPSGDCTLCIGKSHFDWQCPLRKYLQNLVSEFLITLPKQGESGWITCAQLGIKLREDELWTEIQNRKQFKPSLTRFLETMNTVVIEEREKGFGKAKFVRLKNYHLLKEKGQESVEAEPDIPPTEHPSPIVAQKNLRAASGKSAVWVPQERVDSAAPVSHHIPPPHVGPCPASVSISAPSSSLARNSPQLVSARPPPIEASRGRGSYLPRARGKARATYHPVSERRYEVKKHSFEGDCTEIQEMGSQAGETKSFPPPPGIPTHSSLRPPLTNTHTTPLVPISPQAPIQHPNIQHFDKSEWRQDSGVSQSTWSSGGLFGYSSGPGNNECFNSVFGAGNSSGLGYAWRNPNDMWATPSSSPVPRESAPGYTVGGAKCGLGGYGHRGFDSQHDANALGGLWPLSSAAPGPRSGYSSEIWSHESQAGDSRDFGDARLPYATRKQTGELLTSIKRF
eukprot:TRINITY_DN1729_c0_g1_i2.p1 TRINITY_DN1729_c0_g1~~TRINITY_DN1729_c0_g1_i2.p1  ORF type:complete len:875 (+),score=127.64 TRINITY_DN1729_c0_g1_i2:36-2660(+)